MHLGGQEENAGQRRSRVERQVWHLQFAQLSTSVSLGQIKPEKGQHHNC